MAGSGPRRGGMITGINVTPLVDIMLVLLIIFMLTAHVIARHAIEVELPKASEGGTPQASTLNVALQANGTLYLNGAPVTPEALTAAVKAAVAADAKAQVIIAGDANVSHGRIVWVLDLVKSLGVVSFAIQIDPLGTVPPPPAPTALAPAAPAPAAPVPAAPATPAPTAPAQPAP
jgi:biopolymer transport protein ExbD